MADTDNYNIDFHNDKLPVWYIPEEGTIAYHLYPDCGHINQRGEYEFAKEKLAFERDVYDTLDDFTDQIRDGRHMCDSCWSRFTSDWFKWSMENDEPLL